MSVNGYTKIQWPGILLNVTESVLEIRIYSWAHISRGDCSFGAENVSVIGPHSGKYNGAYHSGVKAVRHASFFQTSPTGGRLLTSPIGHNTDLSTRC